MRADSCDKNGGAKSSSEKPGTKQIWKKRLELFLKMIYEVCRHGPKRGVVAPKRQRRHKKQKAPGKSISGGMTEKVR